MFNLWPTDCALDDATARWLLAAVAGLGVACICLVAQAVLLWRRLTPRQPSWRLPLAMLQVVWAVVCGLVAVHTWDEYRAVTTPSLRDLHSFGLELCIVVAQTGVYARLVLIGAAVLLVLGWLALFTLHRRARAA